MLILFLKNKKKKKSKAYQKMQPGRQSLPAWAHRNELIEAVRKNNVIVISGETGCG